MCHDPQHSGACWTYFPWPQTRHVDPGSILAEQCTTLDEATKVGMQNTDSHVCVPSLLVHKCVYIYLTSTGNFPSLEINKDIYIHICELKVMAHRHEHLCSASQLWLPPLALCIVLPECFQGLCICSGAMGRKSANPWNLADHNTTLVK